MSETIDYDRLYDELDTIFPRCPFVISCVDTIDELDKVFINEKVIFIYDNRPLYNYYYDGVENPQQYHNYTLIIATGEYITLRDIIDGMINDSHYHRNMVKHDPHRFLEGFDKSSKSNIQYTASFGS